MTPEFLADDKVSLYCGDCLDVLKTLEANSIDSIVTDPPYGLEFMGKGWDGADGFRRSLNKADANRESVHGRMSKRGPEYRAGALFQEFMKAVAVECLRVLKPGGHLLAFGGTRTYHRMVCGVEDSGFEIRDQIQWLYGSGFPKSHDVSKGIDRAAGAEREVIGSRRVSRVLNAEQIKGDNYAVGLSASGGDIDVTSPATETAREWSGWGTALKPACEPIVLARRPLSESTVAANVLRWGTGALNIDGCRVEHVTVEGGSLALNPHLRESINGGNGGQIFPTEDDRRVVTPHASGRWPANVIHDGSAEVVEAFPNAKAGGNIESSAPSDKTATIFGKFTGRFDNTSYGDEGSAARFFYSAKADSDDRLGSKHPTVKPVDLIAYLVRLVTPPRGLVLDPFAGTGTLGEACIRERMRAILIERESDYQDDIRRRMRLALSGSGTRKRAIAAVKHAGKPFEEGLFAPGRSV